MVLMENRMAASRFQCDAFIFIGFILLLVLGDT